MYEQVDIKREVWLQSLESGDYKQTKYTLKEKKEDGSFGFCCLGVAREVLFETEQKYFIRNEDGINDGDSEDYEMVREELDINHGLKSELISRNDDHNNTFLEIAEFLRKEWRQPKGSVVLKG